MKNLMRFVSVACCALLCISAAGCADRENAAVVPNTCRYEDLSLSSDIKESGLVCENGAWSVEWDKAESRVSFVEKATGAVWGPTPFEATENRTDSDGMQIKNHPQIESAIMVHYFDAQTLDEKAVLSSTDAVANDGVYAQKLDNGLRVIYDFVELEIAVPVEYTIEEDRFLITVKPEEIADNGEFFVTAVSVAPFMCGVENTRTDSWLFLPDGTGVLITPREMDVVGNTGTVGIYGEDLSVQTYDFTTTVKQMNLPVYGVKKGNGALVGIIESAAENASLSWNIGSQNIRYSSVYPFFRIRGYSYIAAPSGFSSPLAEVKVFDDGINTTPIRVAYYSLNGAKADISGMAEVYRNHLIKNCGLTEKAQDEKLAAFKYVGAAVQPTFVLGMPTTKLYALTTTANAALMTEELSEAIGNDFYIDLVGFGTTGIDIGKLAGGYTVAGGLGGKSGMKKLAGVFGAAGLDWYMDFDLVSFYKSGNGISKNNDVSVLPNGQAVWFSSYDTVTRDENDDRFFLLKRSSLEKAVSKLTEKASALTLSGISLDSLSNTVWSDYDTPETLVNGRIASDATQAFNTVKQSGYKFLATAANDYAAVCADAIIDAPLYSSGYDITRCDVPFYQMVFKGYVPMSSASINLCADERDALLRCVQTGISPSYTLTYNYDNELITSQHSFIYGSNYSGNKQKITETVNSLREYLESVKGAKISRYVNPADSVSITGFDNGVWAAVNFGDTPAETQYGEIPAHSWITGREAQ